MCLWAKWASVTGEFCQDTNCVCACYAPHRSWSRRSGVKPYRKTLCGLKEQRTLGIEFVRRRASGFETRAADGSRGLADGQTEWVEKLGILMRRNRLHVEAKKCGTMLETSVSWQNNLKNLFFYSCSLSWQKLSRTKAQDSLWQNASTEVGVKLGCIETARLQWQSSFWASERHDRE